MINNNSFVTSHNYYIYSKGIGIHTGIVLCVGHTTTFHLQQGFEEMGSLLTFEDLFIIKFKFTVQMFIVNSFDIIFSIIKFYINKNKQVYVIQFLIVFLLILTVTTVNAVSIRIRREIRNQISLIRVKQFKKTLLDLKNIILYISRFIIDIRLIVNINIL